MKKTLLIALSLCLASAFFSSCEEKIESEQAELDTIEAAMSLVDKLVTYSNEAEAKAYLTSKGYYNVDKVWFKSKVAADTYEKMNKSNPSKEDLDAVGIYLEVEEVMWSYGRLVATLYCQTDDYVKLFETAVETMTSRHKEVAAARTSMYKEANYVPTYEELLASIDQVDYITYLISSFTLEYDVKARHGDRCVNYSASRRTTFSEFSVAPGKKVAWAETLSNLQPWSEAVVSKDSELRLLTKEEWDYLFNGRPDAGYLWARARYDYGDGNYAYFVLVLSDNSELEFFEYANESNWDDNTLEQGGLYELSHDCGVIVLHCDGYQNDGGYSIGTCGYYWTSSKNDYGTPYYLAFDKDLAPSTVVNSVYFPATTLMSACYFYDIK